MSAYEGGEQPAGGGPGTPGETPSEEELRAAYEAELARIDATDMIAQATVSLLNVGAARLGPAPDAPGGGGRDLEQARDAIDAAKALLAILERRIPGELAGLRDALSRLQMAYAREAGATPGGTGGDPGAAGTGGGEPRESGEGAQGGEPQSEPEEPGQRGPGPAESSGRLWVPGR
jgi:hypothetical protein